MSDSHKALQDDAAEAIAMWKARAEKAEAELGAAIRELERWRHDVTVEGDFICPDSLALDEWKARAENAEYERDRYRYAIREALEYLTDKDPRAAHAALLRGLFTATLLPEKEPPGTP